MKGPSEMCHKPTPCPCLLGKTGRCGHQVLYDESACWRRDGRPKRKVGLQNETSPYSGGSENDDTCD